MNRRLLVACLALVLGVQLALVAYFGGWFQRQPAHSDKGEGTGDAAEVLPSREAMERALPAFFASVGAALRANDGNTVADHLDVNRLFLELREGQQTAPPVVQRMAAEAFRRQALLPPWSSCALGRVQFSDTPGEAVVDARHRAPGGGSFHMRWWLKYRRGAWRFYDWEDRERAERFSTLVKRDKNPRPDSIAAQAAGQLQAADWFLKWGNVARATFLLDEVAKVVAETDVTLPAAVAARRWVLTGEVELRRGQPRRALEALAKAERSQPAMPCLHRLRGRALNALGEYDKALIQVNRYTELLGEDAGTTRDRGIALAGLGRREEAVAAFRKASQEDPGVVSALLTEMPRADTLPPWQVEVKWEAGDYASVVRLLNDQRKTLFAHAAHRDRLRDHLVRSLVRLGRFDEARKEAEHFDPEQPLLCALAHAAAGDVDKTAAALERCDRQGRSAADYYADPDFGPLLRSASFRQLAQKYPSP